MSSARVREAQLGIPRTPGYAGVTLAGIPYVCERKERGGCQASPPPPPPPPSHGGVRSTRRRRRRHHSPPIFFRRWLPLRGRRRNCRSSFPLLPLFVLFPALRAFSPFSPPSLSMSLLSLTLPRTYLPFHRARLASFALVPFPSSFRPTALRFLLLFVPKNDGVEGRAAKRDGKDESNKEGEILEHGDKRRGGFHRLTVVGGRREGRFPVVGIFLDVERRRTHTHTHTRTRPTPLRLYLRTLFLLQRCNRRLYYFRERERKCSKRRKTGVENGRGLFDTRGGREEAADAKVIVQLVTQTDPSSFSSSGATCVSRARAYLPV